MALQELCFSYRPNAKLVSIPKDWSHTGVVGSGDMEVLMRRRAQSGDVRVKVLTPVKGFDEVWDKVLRKFVNDTGLYDVDIEINDNNSTPFIVAARLKQALIEAQRGDE